MGTPKITKEQITQYVEAIAMNINAVILNYEDDPSPGAILLGIMDEIDRIDRFRTPEIGQNSFSKIMVWAILGIRSAISADPLDESPFPAAAIHPGEMLKDELEVRKISYAEFAPKIGMTPGELYQVTIGQKDLNLEHVLLIAKALDMKDDIWINAQLSYLQSRLKKYRL